jgi:hypothetical protein
VQLKRFRSATQPLTLDPLVFWADKTVTKQYPTLASLALQVFATQASSVASERAFSAVGDVLTKKRNAMDSSTVCFCVVLSMNESTIPDVTLDLYDRAHDTVHAWKLCFGGEAVAPVMPLADGCDGAEDFEASVRTADEDLSTQAEEFSKASAALDASIDPLPDDRLDDADGEESDAVGKRVGVAGRRIVTSVP